MMVIIRFYEGVKQAIRQGRTWNRVLLNPFSFDMDPDPANDSESHLDPKYSNIHKYHWCINVFLNPGNVF